MGSRGVEVGMPFISSLSPVQKEDEGVTMYFEEKQNCRLREKAAPIFLPVSCGLSQGRQEQTQSWKVAD